MTTSSQYILENWSPGDLFSIKVETSFSLAEPFMPRKWISKKTGEFLIFLCIYKHNNYFIMKLLAKDQIIFDFWVDDYDFELGCFVPQTYNKIEL